MSFAARGYGGYEDVVGSPLSEQPGGAGEEEQPWGADGNLDPYHEDYAASGSSQGAYGIGKQQQGGSPASTVSTTLEQASSILSRIPGAKTVSYANAGLFGGCGVVAALVAWLAGLSLLLVLLARWYLPAHESSHSLPLHFDYAAGPAAAVVWVPLLKPSHLADSLSPPAKPYTAAAAGLRGFLTPSSSSSSYGRQSSSSSSGRTGLGFSPLSRHSSSGGSSSSDNSTAGEGLWARISGRSRRRRRAAARAAAAASASVLYDIGNGVSLPDADWLVPLRGDAQLSVELDMPGWPPADMVQVSGELFTTYGISLGRWSASWLPKPRPLLFRLASSLLLGPWHALGLLDDTQRVELQLFSAFHNPAAPPGGWGSLPGYRRFIQKQQQLMQWGEEGEGGAAFGSAQSGGGFKGRGGQGFGGQGDEEEEEDVAVPWPRALWLRVTLSGRSYEAGPPRVYQARAKLDVDRGVFDWLLACLRPSLVTALLVLSVGGAFMVGGTGTAAVLLYVAYRLYRWGSRIGAEQQEQQQLRQEAEGGPGGLEHYAAPPGYEPWQLEDFVEQEGYGTPLNAEEGELPVDYTYDDDYATTTHHHLPISEEEGEEEYEEATTAAAAAAAAAGGQQYAGGYSGEDQGRPSTSASSEGDVYQEPDFTAGADELYSSPRALDGDRSRYHFHSSHPDSSSGAGGYARRPSFEGGVGRHPLGSASSSDAGGAEQWEGERDRSPAAPAAAAVAAAAAVGPSAAAAAPAVAPATPGLGSSRLWSVLGGGKAPPAAPAPQQQQQQREWCNRGDEDLPPSLAAAASGSNGGSGAAAAGAAAVRGGSSGEGAAGEVEEYQEASTEMEGLAETTAADPSEPEWRRQLLEESDDEQQSSQQQQQQMPLRQQHGKGDLPGHQPPAAQQQQQQQGAAAADLLLRDKPAAAADAPVKRRFGFKFRR